MNLDLIMSDIDFKTHDFADLPERLAQLERDGTTIAPVRYGDGRAWLIVGHEEVSRILGDDNGFPAAIHYDQEFDTFGKILLRMHGSEHRKYRALFNAPFSPAAVRKYTENILKPLADELIDEFGTRRRIDIYKDFAARFSLNVISRLIGISMRREDEPRFSHLLEEAIQNRDRYASIDEARDRSRAAASQLDDILLPIIAQRRQDPQDDVVSYLACAELDGRRLPDQEVAQHVRFIYIAGSHSTGVQIGNVLGTLLDQPELQQRFSADREGRGAIIDEVVRLNGVTGLIGRTAPETTVLRGIEIKKGERLIVGIPGANRDMTKFPQPEKIRLDRKHYGGLTFGKGAHLCMGIHLARQEMIVAVERLLARLPGLRLAAPSKGITGGLFRVIPDVIVEFDDQLPAD